MQLDPDYAALRGHRPGAAGARDFARKRFLGDASAFASQLPSGIAMIWHRDLSLQTFICTLRPTHHAAATREPT